MNPATLILALLLVMATAALFWFLLRQGAQRTAHQYRILAERFGLEVSEQAPRAGGFIRGEPSAYGRWQGREMSVSVPGKGLQGTRQVETVLKMELRDKGFQMQATAAGMLGRLRQRGGVADERWESGDGDFDRVVDLRVSDLARATRTLDGDLRDRLAGILKGGKSTLYVRGGVMAFSEYGLLADDAARERFERAAEVLEAIAQALEANA